MASTLATQTVSLSRCQCWRGGLSVEEPIRSDRKGVHRSGVSTRMAAGSTTEDALLGVVLGEQDSVEEAYMTGRVLPSHEVQYFAVKSSEARRSSSGNMSQGFQSGGESILDERTALGVSETGGDPEEGVTLGSLSTEGPSSAEGVEEGPASAISGWIADGGEGKGKIPFVPVVAMGCANRGS